MAPVIVGILVWQMLLSGTMIAVVVTGIKQRAVVHQRIRELDLEASLNAITRQLGDINLQRHHELRAAVQLFIDRCRKDPITAERRHLDIIELESILNHGR